MRYEKPKEYTVSYAPGTKPTCGNCRWYRVATNMADGNEISYCQLEWHQVGCNLTRKSDCECHRPQDWKEREK